MQSTFTLKVSNLKETVIIAKKIAQSILPNFIIGFQGNLGSGKTTLIREIILSFGIIGSVKSPTFTLVETYKENKVLINHFDAYRLDNAESWNELGFNEYLENESINFIEWVNKVITAIPQIDWCIFIDVNHEEERLITISSYTLRGDLCLQKLKLSVEV